MGLLAIIALVVVAVGAGAGLALARSAARAYERQGQIVPGVPSRAPASWAGAHTPEARLHRRLVDAVAAVRANEAVDAVASARATFETEALAVDERLVAAAALPASVRGEALAKVEAAVVALEQAAAGFALEGFTSGAAALDRAVAEVDERMRALAEARAELDRAAGG